MNRIEITFNGRDYAVACEDGQEERVLELAAMVDEKVSAIAKSAPSASDAHLLALTSLVLADEAVRNRHELEEIEERGMAGEDETLLVAAVQHLTHRIHGLAEGVVETTDSEAVEPESIEADAVSEDAQEQA